MDMFNKISDMEQALNFRSMRHKVLTSNITNLDTPRYRSFDLVLNEEMEGRGSRPAEVRLERTHSRHIGKKEASLNGNAAAQADAPSPYSLREDGNTVDIDKEMYRLSENTFMYTAFSQIVSKEFQLLKTAIEER